VSDLRILTVQQPHAWAIVSGHKDVENRTWPFPLRHGTTIAIHAGMKHDRRGLRVDVDEPDYFVRGAVVGFATVVDCHAAEECDCSPWAANVGFHWRLADAWALSTPVPATGRLWLFRPSDDVKSTLTEELLARQGRTAL
jgi:hypothetical protein